MGADLITFVCVGPKNLTLSAARRRNVVQHAMNRRKRVLETACRDLAKTRKLSPEQLRQTADFEDALEDFLRNECDGEEILVNVTPKDVREPLERLINLWNGDERPHDLVYRLWKNRRIVVAGDMSWGDEPEGYGYQLLKQAQTMGLLDALGIE